MDSLSQGRGPDGAVLGRPGFGLRVGESGVLPEHWTNGMLGFPPTEENQHEEEQIYR